MSRLRMVRVVTGGAVALAVMTGMASAATPSGPPLSLAWLYPAPAPAGWKHLGLKSEGTVLWYPPSLRQVAAPSGSVTFTAKDGSGNDRPR